MTGSLIKTVEFVPIPSLLGHLASVGLDPRHHFIHEKWCFFVQVIVHITWSGGFNIISDDGFQG